MEVVALVLGGIAAVAGVVAAAYAAVSFHKRRSRRDKVLSEPARRPYPRQQHDFVGRKKDIEEIVQRLATRTFIVEIVGMGGIGKTALAIAVVERLMARGTFAGVVWVSAKYQRVSLEIFLRDLLAYLYGPTGGDFNVHEAIELARRDLASRAILLVVDNYEEVDDNKLASFLCDVPAPSKVLATTRVSVLDSASRYELGGLPADDSLRLARQESKEGERRTWETPVLQRIAAASHGVPFVIIWFFGQVRGGQDAITLLGGIEKAGLAASELYDYIFARTFEILEGPAFDLLCTCALFENPFTFGDLLGFVDTLQPEEISRFLAAFKTQSVILVEAGPHLEKQWLSMHPLTRRYALHRARAAGTLSELKSAFFRKLLKRADEDAKSGGPSYDFLGPHISTAIAALDWFVESMEWSAAVRLEKAVSRYLWVRGHWDERVACGRKALGAAQCLGRREAEAWILMDSLGWTLFRLQGDSEEVREDLERSRELFDEAKEPFGRAKVRRHLAAIARDRGDFDTAAAFYDEIEEISREIPSQQDRLEMEAGLELSQGKLAGERGDWERALAHFEKSAELFGENGDSLRRVKSLTFKAEALMRLEHYGQAREALDVVVRQAKALERVDHLARAYELRAHVWAIIGNNGKSSTDATRSATIFLSLGDRKSLERVVGDFPTAAPAGWSR